MRHSWSAISNGGVKKAVLFNVCAHERFGACSGAGCSLVERPAKDMHERGMQVVCHESIDGWPTHFARDRGAYKAFIYRASQLGFSGK